VGDQRSRCGAWFRRHKTVMGSRRELSGFDREEYRQKGAPPTLPGGSTILCCLAVLSAPWWDCRSRPQVVFSPGT
jgi:hypothetical protein